MLNAHQLKNKHRLPASARTAAITTAGLWSVAVLLFTGQAQGDIALADIWMQVIVYWLLFSGCTAFWLTFMRVGEELVHADWHIAYELDPAAILTPGRDRKLDRVLARGLATDRRPSFWPAGTWKVFFRVGIAFWMITAAASVMLLARWLRIDPPQRGVLLVIMMIPAAQCTAASVIGPGLTRMLELREAAREARRRLCEQAPTTMQLDATGRPTVAQEDLRETVIIHLGEMHEPTVGAKDRRLHIAGDRPAPRRRYSG